MTDMSGSFCRSSMTSALPTIRSSSYTTDNGAEVLTWPDGRMTPFRGEKNTNWEGGFRVLALLRWPGTIKPGTIINDPTSALDWFPTFAAAAGVSDVKQSLLTGSSMPSA
jgi:arylsulfatase A-like enzyme